jgi:hypothetical protein
MVSQTAKDIHLLHQKRLACDAITEVFEELEYRGTITEEVKEECYQELALSCGFLDLLHPTIQHQPIQGANMGTNSAIIERSANAKIPEGVVEKLANTKDTVLGYATVMPDAQGTPQLVIAANVDPAQLGEYLEITSDVDLIFQLDATQKTKEIDHQPFVLAKSEANKPLLVCFVEGDFEDFHDSDGSTDVAHFVRDYLQPKIDDMLDMADQDIGKVTTALQKESVANDIKAKFGERCVVQFMSVEGVAFSIENNDKRVNTDWGSCSIVEGEYPREDKIAHDKAVETNPLLAKIAAQKAAKAAAAGTHKTDATPKSLNKPADQAPLQEDIKNAGKTKPLVENRLVYPPINMCGSKNSLTTWYNNGWGTKPANADIAVKNPKASVGMPRSELKAKYLDDPRYMCFSPGGSISLADGKNNSDKPDHIDANTGLPVAPGTTAGGFPVIPAGQKQVVTPWLATIDMKSQDIFDPTKIQEIEKRASTFFEQYPGVMPKDVILRMPDAKIDEMAIKWPESHASLVKSLRFYAAMFFLNQKKTADAEETTHELAKEELKPSGNPLLDRIKAGKKTAAA